MVAWQPEDDNKNPGNFLEMPRNSPSILFVGIKQIRYNVLKSAG